MPCEPKNRLNLFEILTYPIILLVTIAFLVTVVFGQAGQATRTAKSDPTGVACTANSPDLFYNNGRYSCVSGVYQSIGVAIDYVADSGAAAAKPCNASRVNTKRRRGYGNRGIDTCTLMQDGSTYAWVDDDGGRCNLLNFGGVGDGVTNNYTALSAMFAAAAASGDEWYIPPGTFFVDTDSSLSVKTGGVAVGTLVFPKSKKNLYLLIERDTAGSTLSTAGWSLITRNGTSFSAANAENKNLYIDSTEVFIERDGSLVNGYVRREFIRASKSGIFTTPAVHSYTSYSNVTVTAHTPSTPIAIKGLKISITGADAGAESGYGRVNITRDNVTISDLKIVNENPAEPISQGLYIYQCADVVVERPYMKGLNFTGLGYGIQTSATIGVKILDGTILDARKPIAGRNDVDVTVDGGVYEGQLDSHWGDRVRIANLSLKCPSGAGGIEFAGNDIDVSGITQTNGRNVLSIRTDTPTLGGIVRMDNIKWYTRGESPYVYLFGFSTPSGPSATHTLPTAMPELIRISNVNIDTDSTYIIGAYLTCPSFSHASTGRIDMIGSFTTTAPIIGVLLFKDSTYQSRALSINIDGPIDFQNYPAIYLVANDAGSTYAASAVLNNIRNADIRYSHYGLSSLFVSNSSVRNLTNDNAAHVVGSGTYYFRNNTFVGTSIASTLGNLIFHNNVFTTTYSTFPSTPTMLGNYRTGSAGSLPTNIYSFLNGSSAIGRTPSLTEAAETFSGVKTFTAAPVISSNSANALAVGANGTTNPALQVDASTGSVATGVKITGAAAGGNVAIAAISSGSNESLQLSSKGTGLVLVGDTSTTSAVAGAATLNVQRGTVTSEALTTAAGASYTLTLTNSKITTSSMIFVSFTDGTNTQGTLELGKVTPGSGSATIIIRNTHSADALNGTIKINFLVM